MKLHDALILKEGDSYRLESLISGYLVQLNEQSVEIIKSMGTKNIDLFDEFERHIFLRLQSEGSVSQTYSKILVHDITNKPSTIGIEITESCITNCLHCYLDKKSNIILDTATFKRIIDQSRELGTYFIELTGGEPFLDEEIFDKIAYARKNGMKVVISTNGALISEKHAKTLRHLNVAEIIITLSGFEEQHDFLYGKGFFKMAIKGIRRLSDEGVAVSINYIVYPKNIKTLDSTEFISLCKNLGVKRINPSPISLIGNARNHPDLRLSKEDHNSLFEIDLRNKKIPKSLGLACSAQRNTLFIKSNGDVQPCHMFAGYFIGNINVQDLKQIYYARNELKTFDYSRLKHCNKCDMFEVCFGGCRGRAYVVNKDLSAPDLEYCFALGKEEAKS